MRMIGIGRTLQVRAVDGARRRSLPPDSLSRAVSESICNPKAHIVVFRKGFQNWGERSEPLGPEQATSCAKIQQPDGTLSI